jgi:hypothetical protein
MFCVCCYKKYAFVLEYCFVPLVILYKIVVYNLITSMDAVFLRIVVEN